MGGSINGGTPKSSILMGFSIISHLFLGSPMTMETSIMVIHGIHTLKIPESDYGNMRLMGYISSNVIYGRSDTPNLV